MIWRSISLLQIGNTWLTYFFVWNKEWWSVAANAIFSPSKNQNYDLVVKWRRNFSELFFFFYFEVRNRKSDHIFICVKTRASLAIPWMHETRRKFTWLWPTKVLVLAYNINMSYSCIIEVSIFIRVVQLHNDLFISVSLYTFGEFVPYTCISEYDETML